jgi:hypothetical protein
MLDCGKSASRSWSPSAAYCGQRIDTFLIQNLDEDHVEDFANLWKQVPIGGLLSNPTISAAALSYMKPQGMRSGVQQVHDVLLRGGTRLAAWDQYLGGVQWHAFWNRWASDFLDTNNLSLATFVSFGSFTILLGGDLETAGWRKLLERPDFLLKLMSVDVLVASHHGRENGQCPELFNWCKPKLIIFSDGPKQYESQETAAWYGGKASGVVDWTRPAGPLGLRPLRRVMTTRKDGTVRIDVDARGNWTAYRNPRRPIVGSYLMETMRAAQPPVLRNALLG